MNGTTIHGIKKIEAYRRDYENAPLKLTIKTEYSDYASEVCLFFSDGNDATVKLLVDAINAAQEPSVQVQEAAA